MVVCIVMYEYVNLREKSISSSIRTLLSNPRWEKRLLRFLELSGVGRVVEGGEDEDEAHAAQMDRWVVWEAEEEEKLA